MSSFKPPKKRWWNTPC